MKIQAGKTITTLAVLILATLMTVDMSQARMGGGGHNGSSGSGMSGDSGRGGDDVYGDRDRDRDEKHRSRDSYSGAYESISTGGMANGGVLMELKPGGIIDGKFHVRFSASTRSGDLGDYDLLKQCTLEYGDKVIHPTGLIHMNGRHAEGTMVFDLDEMPEHFSIIVSGIPGENHRVHKW